MKNVILFLMIVILLFKYNNSFSQVDSVFVKTEIKKELKPITDSISKINAKFTEIQKEADPKNKTNYKLNGWEIVLVFLPIIIFIIASIYVLERLKKENFRLGDALRENFLLDISNTEENRKKIEKSDIELKVLIASDSVSPTEALKDQIKEKESEIAKLNNTTESIQPQSTSRLIAFLSGMTAIIIAISTTSYFFYVYLTQHKAPDLDELYNVVLTLGIGIIPYGFNKVQAIFK